MKGGRMELVLREYQYWRILDNGYTQGYNKEYIALVERDQTTSETATSEAAIEDLNLRRPSEKPNLRPVVKNSIAFTKPAAPNKVSATVSQPCGM